MMAHQEIVHPLRVTVRYLMFDSSLQLRSAAGLAVVDERTCEGAALRPNFLLFGISGQTSEAHLSPKPLA